MVPKCVFTLYFYYSKYIFLFIALACSITFREVDAIRADSGRSYRNMKSVALVILARSSLYR